MKTLAIVPAHERLTILEHTLNRLINVNGFDHVICVAGEGEKETIEKTGAEYLEHVNYPLGRKLNFAFEKAKEHKPDIVTYVGSTNWLSNTWLKILSPELEKHMMTGKTDFNILDYDRKKMIRFLHYPAQKLKWHQRLSFKYQRLSEGEKNFIQMGGRINEPVGIGRLLRSDFLDAIDWQPFNNEDDKRMDSAMMTKLAQIGGSYSLCRDYNAQSLKITSRQWSSLNPFEVYQTYDSVKDIICPLEYLWVWFPEIFNIKL